jgi:hypothetical protein
VYNSGSADPNFIYCDIKGCGGSGSWDPNFGTNGGGNIDSDPNFVDVNDAEGLNEILGTSDDGLRIQANSGCVDAADGDAAPSTDITGQTRIDVSYVTNTGTGDPDYADIGAYEAPMVWYVDCDAGGMDDGSSWTNAFNDLQDALSSASGGHEIWAAEGTYKPTSGTSRSVYFQLVQDVAVYGGFAGTETGRHQRDWTSYETILSGDIGTTGDANDNSYHVVSGADDAILDGFTVTGGNASTTRFHSQYGGGIVCFSVSSTIRNCTIKSNNAFRAGGGMYNARPCSPTIANCFFIDNTATYSGGGLCNDAWGYGDCYAEVTNCVFTGNEASYGGAVNNRFGLSTFTNCTFSKNEASTNGGAMFNAGAEAPVTNCIFWSNIPNQIYSVGPNSTFSYCDIEDSNGTGLDWDSSLGNDGGGTTFP